MQKKQNPDRTTNGQRENGRQPVPDQFIIQPVRPATVAILKVRKLFVKQNFRWAKGAIDDRRAQKNNKIFYLKFRLSHDAVMFSITYWQ